VNLKRLEQLVAIEEDGSLASAARRLHISQPALTRSIQVLEEEAGFALLDRGARGVSLTPAGRMVVARARRILFETRCLARDLSLMQNQEVGSVTIAVGSFAAAIVLPDLLSILHRERPHLRLVAQAMPREGLLEALRSEKADFIVADQHMVPLDEDLTVQLLPAMPAAAYARPGHPLAQGRASVAQLRAADLVSVAYPPAGLERVRKILRCGPGEELSLRVECNDMRALARLTAMTDAIVLAPPAAVREEVEAGALVALEVRELSALSAQMAIVHLTQRTLSPAAARGVEIIQSIFGYGAGA